MSRNFAGMSRTPEGVQKLRAKKVRAHFSFPSFESREFTDSPELSLFQDHFFTPNPKCADVTF